MRLLVEVVFGTLPIVALNAIIPSDLADDGNAEGWIDLDGLKAHTGTALYPGGQAAIITAALSNYCVTVLNGRSSGKTMGLFILLNEEGGRCKGRYEFAYVAPAHSTAEKFYRMVKHAFDDMVVASANKGQDRWLEIAPWGENDGAVINCWSGEPGSLDNVRGPRLNRLAFDEAPNVHKSALAACAPMLTGRDGKMICEGTARRGGCGNGWFGDLMRRAKNGEEGYVAFNMPTESSPYNLCKKEGCLHREHPIEAVMRDRRLFRDPNALDVVTESEREEFNGEIITDVGAYFRNLDACIIIPVLRHEPGLYIFEDPAPGDTYVIGADWGRKKDHSVSAVFNRRTRNMAALRIEPSGENVKFDPQMERLDALKRRYCNAMVISDAVGVSAYVNERLQIQFGDRFREVGFTGRGESSKEAHCSRLKHIIDVEGIHLGNVPELRKEFEAFAQVPIGESQNGFRYEGTGGVHDDIVTAVVFAANVLQIEPSQRPKPSPLPIPLSVEHFRQLAQQKAMSARRVRW